MMLERRPGFLPIGQPGVTWLGQAGFWVDTGEHRLLIDPYLSDSLAKKYAGQKNDHQRIAPPPVSIDALPRPDLVLVTHGHTDHLDPETLAPLHSRFRDVPFVVPAACADLALERIGQTARLVLVCADERLELLPRLTLTVFPAAYEELETDERGHHKFVGYGIEAPSFRLWHSGDCVPYDGLTERVGEFAPQVALMPVNGRDAERRADGIPGNFHLSEAIEICRNARVMSLIPHHFGMFAFNSLDRALIEEAEAVTSAPRIWTPALGDSILLGGKTLIG